MSNHINVPRNVFIVFFLFFVVLPGSGQVKLSCAQFYGMMNDDSLIVLDVRIKEKFKVDRIPGAEYAGEKDVLLNKMEGKSADINILLYCDYGQRSRTVMKILKKEGFKNLYHLRDGFIEWKKNDFPVDDYLIE